MHNNQGCSNVCFVLFLTSPFSIISSSVCLSLPLHLENRYLYQFHIFHLGRYDILRIIFFSVDIGLTSKFQQKNLDFPTFRIYLW